MRRRGETRKVNYAAYVKTNMPVLVDKEEIKNDIIVRFIPINARVWGKKVLDNFRVLIIIIFTHATACTWVPDARKRCQTRHSPATRNSKSTASCGHRSPVCPRQLLR